jgi:hypothetical protein
MDNIIQNKCIQISDKTYFYFENFKDFLKKNPEIPLCNRDYIEERVNEFYIKICNYSKNVGDETIPYLNVIHTALLNKKLYICDGQHRYYAMKKFYDDTEINFKFPYMVKICDSKEELRNYFKDLNNVFVLHDIILDDDKIDLLERIKIYMKNKYNGHISQSANPRFPNINIDQLVNYLSNSYLGLNYTSIICKMEQLNNKIKEECKLFNKDLYDTAMKKQGFFIGYLFIKTEAENKRKHIPQTVRNMLWSKSYDESINGKCYVCKCKVTIHTFHAGHKISVKKGGTNNINNLEIVCSSCNLSMGSQDLEEFKKMYF